MKKILLLIVFLASFLNAQQFDNLAGTTNSTFQIGYNGVILDSSGITLAANAAIKTIGAGVGANGIILDTAGLRGYSAILGETFNLPTNGTAPYFSSGIIKDVIFEIYTSGVIRTSGTVGDGSTSSAGVLINNTGFYAVGPSETPSTANLRILTNGNVLINNASISWAGMNKPTQTDLGTWTTYISSSGIYTGILTANQVNSVNVIADSIIAGKYISSPIITGGVISGGTITGGVISGGTMTGGVISGGIITGTNIYSGSFSTNAPVSFPSLQISSSSNGKIAFLQTVPGVWVTITSSGVSSGVIYVNDNHTNTNSTILTGSELQSPIINADTGFQVNGNPLSYSHLAGNGSAAIDTIGTITSGIWSATPIAISKIAVNSAAGPWQYLTSASSSIPTWRQIDFGDLSGAVTTAQTNMSSTSTAPTINSITPAPVIYGTNGAVLTTPTTWIQVKVGSTTYKVPGY